MSTIDFTSFLKLMAHQKASDLFITAGMPPSMKVHGKISPITQNPLTPQQSRDLVLNVMTPQQREEFEKTHECNFAIGVTGVGRFRVSCFYQRNQVGMVLRRIETKIPTVEELNLPPIIKTLAMTKRGIIIFVGATGTGKSTSLAAMIGYRNMNSTGHIITIEDPIEFVHKHEGCIITQREVGIDTDSWDAALKNTLRQAPDVIMIGEVRTREGMDHAIAFAETGHLVLCTLHANNANQAMDRIINFFPEDRRGQLLMDLSLNLKGVVAQQLIPTPDGKGRRVAMEILLGTPLVQDYIRDGEIHKLKEVMKESVQLGMKTFDQSLFELYQAGEISLRRRAALRRLAERGAPAHQAGPGRRRQDAVAGAGWRGSRRSTLKVAAACSTRSRDLPAFFLLFFRSQTGSEFPDGMPVPSMRQSRQRRLKYCTSRSCFSAAARVWNVPKLRRLPVRGSFLARVQPVSAGWKLTNHGAKPGWRMHERTSVVTGASSAADVPPGSVSSARHVHPQCVEAFVMGAALLRDRRGIAGKGDVADCRGFESGGFPHMRVPVRRPDAVACARTLGPVQHALG